MPIMREVAKSDNVHARGFDPSTHVFAIHFKGKDGKPDNKLYHFKDVPAEVAEPLMAMDEGVGRAFHKAIRNKFPHEVVPA